MQLLQKPAFELLLMGLSLTHRLALCPPVLVCQSVSFWGLG
ncbi:MAG: hypothetical protein ACUVRV_04495 [Cyanobacteriota bacterium]